MDAQTLQLQEKKSSASGSNTDIITSLACAYVLALNKLLTWQLQWKDVKSKVRDTAGMGGAVAIEGIAPAVVESNFKPEHQKPQRLVMLVEAS
jgi:hypothetical protein